MSVGAHDARHHKIALYYVVQLKECAFADQFVCDLYGEQEWFELGVFLFGLYFFDFVGGVDSEHTFYDEHGHYDAHYSEGVGRCISRGHHVGRFGSGGSLGYGLLCGCESGCVGDGSAHYAHKYAHIFDVAPEVYAQGNGDVEHHA